MAVANRFATMVHKNTHKLVLLLVYALLEWVLIALLLMNSLFSYLITKFAVYFGLQKPCLWCSRVDHVFENKPNKLLHYTDLICESHASEISQLGYCSTHRRLSEASEMCWDCSASQPDFPGKFLGSEAHESDEKSVFKFCCCCNERFSREQKLDPYDLLFRPTWGSSELARVGEFDENANNGDEFRRKRVSEENDQFACNNVGSFHSGDLSEEDCLSSSSMFICYEKEAMEDSKAGSLDIARQGSNGSGEFVGQILSDVSIVQRRLEEDDLVESIECSSRTNQMVCDLNPRLIPVELIDFSTRADIGDLHCDLGIASQLKLLETNESAGKTTDVVEVENLETMRPLVDQTLVRDSEEKKQDLVSKASEQVLTTQEVHALQIHVKKAVMTKLNDLPGAVFEENQVEERQLLGDQIISRALVSSQVADCEADKDCSLNGDASETYKVPESAQNDLGPNHTEKTVEKLGQTTCFDTKQERTACLCMLSEPMEPKEDKFPDTPTSIDSLHHFDKKSLASEKRELGAKESVDGSVASELEGVDAISTIEQLKSALKSERKALSLLYAELEEERSASAIAANQTMAMITRLQEEKAAMQMEALQYQRMMEEQSEYDQEALQLLNDLMIKREKEKQELEKELEGCRKKILDYEEKEKTRMIRRIRDGSIRSRNSSASCSHACDSDELSIDLNRELRDEDISFCGHQENSYNDTNNTPADAVMNLEEIALDCVKHMSILDESLTEFEEERLSILDQLKALEEKLVRLGDEDEEFSRDLKLIANSSQSNAQDFEESLTITSTPAENGTSYSFLDENDNHEGKVLGFMAKKLLPFLDAADRETKEGFVDEEKIELGSVDTQSSPFSKFEPDSNKVAIEEEVDHVYERLQALEADREFLKNCMSSIKKGDKGMDLLQEILQHLRDLRTIELQMRNTNDEALGEVTVS